MEIRAYNETYLSYAQNVLGHAVDFSVITLGLNPDTFGNSFAVSYVSKQFEAGNPRFVAGVNGCELAREILSSTQTPFKDTDDVMYLDKSPEYWSGWALAFYQWYSGRPFIEILKTVPLSEIISMYSVYHEMDIMHFADQMEIRIKERFPHTRLREARLNCGYSQSELSSESGVPLRQIQLFEQRQRNINNAAAITLLRLSRALHCSMEELIEISIIHQST